MSAEDAESYLRRFAETQLRRVAGGEATAAECASRVDDVAAAFEGTGVLDSEVAKAVTDGLDVALAARSPERDTPLHAGRRAQVSALRGESGFARVLASPPGRPVTGRRGGPLGRPGRSDGGNARAGVEREEPSGAVSVTPASAVLRSRDEGAKEDVYLLSYVTAPGRAWLNVAARTTAPRLPRRPASPPSARNPRVRPTAGRPSSFAGGGMTAVDDAGRKYDLSFSGGGGQTSPRSGSPGFPGGDGQGLPRSGGRWYLGRLSVSPPPPPGIGWLEVRCGGGSALLDLTERGPDAEVTVRPLGHAPGETFLLRRGETLLGGRGRSAAAEVAGLASAVPALRAVGALPDDSPVPGQLASLAQRLGAPGRLIAEPRDLPARWAAALDASSSAGSVDGNGSIAAARLAAVLPEADGVAVWLSGLVTLPGEGTVLFGSLRGGGPEPSSLGLTPSPGLPSSPGLTSSSGLALWLRDDSGGWHSVSLRGWSSGGGERAFQAAVVPPVGPGTASVEFCVTGASTEVRAAIPLMWWTA